MRKRSRAFAAVAIAAVTLALSLQPARADRSPAVDARALGSGRLAFVWGAALYVLDGKFGSLQRIATVPSLRGLRWSPDGGTLKYESTDYRTWTVRAGRSNAPVPCRASPSCAAIPSADGGVLAYARSWCDGCGPPKERDALLTMPAAGGAPRVRYVAPSGAIVFPAAWWPGGGGVLFWQEPLRSGSIAADGLPLYALSLAGKTPRVLATTLLHADWIARGPAGSRIAIVAGFGREAYRNKRVEACAPAAGTCTILVKWSHSVTLDPAWSPRSDAASEGRAIAVVRADDRGDVGFANDAAYASWTLTRKLWLLRADGGLAHSLAAAGSGVYRPQWSADGTRILFVRDGALWSISPRGGAPRRVVGPFPNAKDAPDDHGYIDWSAVFAYRAQ
jgi:hypothetical protein